MMSSGTAADRPRLSVAMIVRDEESLLPDALRSVRQVADEVVVVDTGSRDATPRVVRDHGGRLVMSPWQDDFSHARNRALEVVTGDWILWLDAGERLSPRCAPRLREFVDGHPDKSKAWLCTIELPPTTSQGHADQIGQTRLIPRRPDLRFSGRVRETLRPALAAAGMTVELGAWRLLRTARDHDPQWKRQKALRDLRLIERELKEQGPSPRLLLALADACSHLGDLKKAAHYYRQVVATAERGSTEMLSAYYGLLTSFPQDMDPGNAQLEVCIEALDTFPYDAQLLCAMGSYLQEQGHLNLAQRSYRAAHEFGQINPETWHIGSIGEVASICLSLNLQLLSDDAAALRVLRDAEVRYPSSRRIPRRRLEVHVKRGEREEALAVLDRVEPAADARNALRDAVEGACLASQKNWTAALPSLERAYEAGCRDPLGLRWYVAALYASGRHDTLQRVLDHWSQLEPQSTEVARYREAVAAAASETPAADQGLAESRAPIPTHHLNGHALDAFQPSRPG
jgi:tetratricopeptide (TPR) repeat protein